MSKIDMFKEVSKDSFVKEIFYYSYKNEQGKIIYEPSSRKFWAAMSQFAFFGALFLKFLCLPLILIIGRIWGFSELITISKYINEQIFTSLILGILAGQAATAMGWYVTKGKIIQKIQEKVAPQAKNIAKTVQNLVKKTEKKL